MDQYRTWWQAENGVKNVKFMENFTKTYFGHERPLEKRSDGATGLEMTSSSSSTTLVLTIFFIKFYKK